MRKAEIVIRLTIEVPEKARRDTIERNAKILHHRAVRDIGKIAYIVHSSYHTRTWGERG